MIKIPNKESFFLKVELYKANTFIGIIETSDQFNEVLALIYEEGKSGKDSSGYYFIWNESKIEISETGRLKQPKLKGFFDWNSKFVIRMSTK